MTRKDYKEIARILRDVSSATVDSTAGSYAQAKIEFIGGELSRYFAAENPRFDPDRFALACKPSVE